MEVFCSLDRNPHLQCRARELITRTILHSWCCKTTQEEHTKRISRQTLRVRKSISSNGRNSESRYKTPKREKCGTATRPHERRKCCRRNGKVCEDLFQEAAPRKNKSTNTVDPQTRKARGQGERRGVPTRVYRIASTTYRSQR